MMDKSAKLAAIAKLAGGDAEEMDDSEEMTPHMAKCPNCGTEFMMGEEDYEEESDEDEDEAY